MPFCRLTIFSLNQTLSKIRVKILSEGQTGPAFCWACLSPNCLQKLSADDTCSQRANSNRESVLHVSARLHTCI